MYAERVRAKLFGSVAKGQYHAPSEMYARCEIPLKI